jgi:hypothetical protein
MKNMLLLFLLFKCFLCYPQCKNSEDYFKLDNSINESEKLNIYINMYKKGVQNIYTDIVQCAYYLKKNKIGYKFLKKAIKTGSVLEGDFINYIPFKTLLKVKKKYSKWRTCFFKNYNEEMYKKILYFLNTDQYLTRENFYGGRKAQHPIRVKVFQNNLTELRSYLISNNKSKLPNKKQIGHLTNAIALLMIHHTSQDSIDEVNYNFFEPLLKEEICNGKTYSPYTYIQLVDNMQLVMEKGVLQVYGHFRDFKTKKIHPLKYPEKVDSLRAAIGLQSLKEYARKNSFLLPDNYIEQN